MKPRCHRDPFWPLEHNIYLMLPSLILPEVTDKVFCKILLYSLFCFLNSSILLLCTQKSPPPIFTILPPLPRNITLVEICRHNRSYIKYQSDIIHLSHIFSVPVLSSLLFLTHCLKFSKLYSLQEKKKGNKVFPFQQTYIFKPIKMFGK